jgi:broad specificity phosphatase PhoE
MRLLLIRHGQTPSNVKRLLDTAEPGPGLTPLGQEQAEALPEVLAAERIGVLYASSLVRTQQTAAPLAMATGLDVQVHDGIRELSAGDLEMRGDDEAIQVYLATTTSWSDGDVQRRMPGGENGVEALRRFDAVVAEAAATGAGTVAMVSHGAAIRTWVAARAENIDAEFASIHLLSNTGVVVLSGTPGDGWRVEAWDGRVIDPKRGVPEEAGIL